MAKNSTDWGDLELFQNSGAKTGTPYITITTFKTLNLSAGFVHDAKEQMQDKKYVELRYSKAKNAIVLNFVDIASRTSFKLTKALHTSNFSISATSFFNHYNITEQGRFEAKLENIPKMGQTWVIYLNNPEE